MSLGQQMLERAFTMLETAAVSGARCPLSSEVPGQSKAFSLLARDGRIVVDIFAQNFRRITILAGPHAGLSTASPVIGNGTPFLTVRKDGTYRNGKLIDVANETKLGMAAVSERQAYGAIGTQARRICFVEGCYQPVALTKFCEAHEYRAPANVARLTARRA